MLQRQQTTQRDLAVLFSKNSPGVKTQTEESETQDPTHIEARPRPLMGAVERLQKRTEFIQKDPMVKALTDKIVELELQLMELSLNLAPNHPSGGSKHDLLEIVSRRLAERKHEIGQQFDDAVEEEMAAQSASGRWQGR